MTSETDQQLPPPQASLEPPRRPGRFTSEVMAGGAVVLPASAYGPFGDVARLLPSGALGEGLRHAFWYGETSWSALLVLAVWAAVGATLTARTFRWE